MRGKRAGIVGKAGRREERGKGDVRSPASGRHARTPDRKAPAPVPETMAWPEAPGSHDHPPPWESRVPEPEFRKNDGSGFRKNGLVQFRKNPKRGSGKTGPRAVPEKWPSSGKGVSPPQDPPGPPQEGPKGLPGPPRTPPKDSPRPPGASREAPRSPPGRPREPLGSPPGLSGLPRSTQDHPQAPSGPPETPKLLISGIRNGNF